MQTQLGLDEEKHAVNNDVDAPRITVRERKWFEDCLKSGRTARVTDIVTVTPGLAGFMLRHNTGNRPLRETRVEKHIDRLTRGDFILTHQGISFARDGVLNDGQSRLTAIYRSGIPGELQVTFGAERDEFKVVDQGEKRSAADTLSIEKYGYAAIRASVASRVYCVRNKAYIPPDQQIVATYAIEIEDYDMNTALAMGYAMHKVTTPTAAALAYYWIIKHTKHQARVPEFFESLRSGENISGIVRDLRDKLKGREFECPNKYANVIHNASGIITGWNGFLQNRKTVRREPSNSVINLPEPR